MKYNLFTLRHAYLQNDLNNKILQEFMNFEKKYIYDNLSHLYQNEDERCLEHIKNIINGGIKEYIFYKNLKQILNIRYREIEVGYYYSLDERKHKGESDFYIRGTNISVELKTSDGYIKNETILKTLNDKDYFLYKYHNANIIYYWMPFYNIIKYAYKNNGIWHIIELKENVLPILKQMESEYKKYKVEKFNIKEVQNG